MESMKAGRPSGHAPERRAARTRATATRTRFLGVLVTAALGWLAGGALLTDGV